MVESTRIIESHAPVRVNDLGGWTDTWFSRHGRVLAIAVSPGADCRLSVTPSRPPRDKRFTLEVRDFGERYSFDPGDTGPGHHPLIEATAASIVFPDDIAVEASIGSGLPPGCGTGGSAAVVVAIIGALSALSSEPCDRDMVWRAAHGVETELLGWQSGIQDQICAAYGGIPFIDIPEYPRAIITALKLDPAVLSELERRLVLVYMGESHFSTDIHHEVIERLKGDGGESEALAALRETPVKARRALLEGDLDSYGEAMIENTESQRSLHPGLISREAQRVIELAEDLGALGWKVNGAGGRGGSLTLLSAEHDNSAVELVRAIETLNGRKRCLPLRIDHKGLVVRTAS